MLFNSLPFLEFFIPVYVLYLFLGHRWQNYLLILASCIFYAVWSWKFLAVMFFSITVDYFCARKINDSEDQSTRKSFLVLSITVNFLILGLFKYFNFFSSNLEVLLRGVHLISTASYCHLNIILPLGISFYTFEAISYIMDVYRREVKPAQNYWDYLLFILYFPHLVAGPIMRAKSFLSQIVTPRTINLNQFYEGCFLFFWGLFEKMYVADNLARIVNPIFSKQGPYEGSMVLVALYAFTFQILCDFDGYSNMARGLGKCMGFDITINFKLPYFASNPREFWQRWHISLSTWLRDYLYIPLGGNRKGEARMYGALLLTMLLGGLWHGASWTFIIWGFYQGVLLIAHRAWTMNSKSPGINTFIKTNSLKYFLKLIIFFHFIVFGWLLFRSQSLHQALDMMHALFFNFKTLDVSLWLTLTGFILPFILVQIWQFKSNDLMVIYKQHWLIKTLIYAFMSYLWLGWGVMNAQEFIYFQF